MKTSTTAPSGFETQFRDALRVYDLHTGTPGAGMTLLGLRAWTDRDIGLIASEDRYKTLIRALRSVADTQTNYASNASAIARVEDVFGSQQVPFLKAPLSSHPFYARGAIADVLIAKKPAVKKSTDLVSSRQARSARKAANAPATAPAASAAAPASKIPAPKAPASDEKAALIEKYRLRGLSEPLARAAAAFAQEGKPAAKKAAPNS